MEKKKTKITKAYTYKHYKEMIKSKGQLGWWNAPLSVFLITFLRQN